MRDAEALPNDPHAADQWALETIGWTTGVRLRSRRPVLGRRRRARHGRRRLDAGPRRPARRRHLDGSTVPLAPIDPNGHGTWMAGIIAAATDNGVGVAGVGYAGVRVMPVTVLGADGLGQDSDIIEGVVWAVQHGADVINMSFSNPGTRAPLQAAIDFAWDLRRGRRRRDRQRRPRRARSPPVTVASSAFPPPTVPTPAPVVQLRPRTCSLPPPGWTSLPPPRAAAPPRSPERPRPRRSWPQLPALLRAADPSASNGVIVGRLARNADPAGSVAETGNGRVNLARALSDTSSDGVKPHGAAPVGDGGPIVGPYVAAAVSVVSFTVGAQVGTAQYGTSSSVTYAISINGNGNGSLPVAVSGLPSGATFSPATDPPTGNCNANSGGGTGCNFTLTITTAAANPAVTTSFDGDPRRQDRYRPAGRRQGHPHGHGRQQEPPVR